jgi:hypothetical protein
VISFGRIWLSATTRRAPPKRISERRGLDASWRFSGRLLVQDGPKHQMTFEREQTVGRKAELVSSEMLRLASRMEIELQFSNRFDWSRCISPLLQGL